MRKVLFIHGFASSGQSSKVHDLQQMLGCEVIAPDLVHEPLLDIKSLEHILNSEPVEMIVGSSLGGFYALILALRLNKKVILINPSLTPEMTLQDQLGEVVSFKGENFTWTTQQICELKTLAQEIQPAVLTQKKHILQKCMVLLAQQDERLNPQLTLEWLANATIIMDTEQGHRFENLDVHYQSIQQFYHQ